MIHKNRTLTLIFGLSDAGKKTIFWRLWGKKSHSTNDLSVRICGKRIPLIMAQDPENREPQIEEKVTGLIFVVDSTDSDFSAAKRLLKSILDTYQDTTIPLLILANKQDNPLSKSPDELAREFDTISILGRRFVSVHGVCALDGGGLKRAFKWLIKQQK